MAVHAPNVIGRGPSSSSRAGVEWQSQLELEHRRHWARKTGEHVVGAAAPRSGVAAGSAILQAALVSLEREGAGEEGAGEGRGGRGG